MPRINFEDSLFKDARFYKLVTLCGGDLDTACGAILRAWILAQKWYRSPTKMIPLPEWEKQEIKKAVIDSGMAVVENGFVYVRGSREQFAWLDEKAESGRKGGEAKARNQKEKVLAEPSTGKQNVASYSSSFSPSSSLSPSGSISDSKSKKAPRVSAKPLEAPRCLPEFESLAEVIRDRGIAEAVQRSWLEAFPDSPWIISEVRKALAWETANPTRKKKRFSAFMTNWMTRGWDSRKTAPSAGRNYAADREASNRAAADAYIASLKELK